MRRHEKKKLKKLYFQEKLIIDITELIARTMDEKGIDIKILAKK